MRLKIDWASHILGRKFTVFLCFALYFRAISKYKLPQGAYIWRGDLMEGFFALRVWGGLYLEGLMHGGAYFRNFTLVSKVVVLAVIKTLETETEGLDHEAGVIN